MSKLQRSFYQQSAQKIAPKLLGKYLVFNSPLGKVSGKIIEVEAYPAFLDDVNHGNKKTRRTKVLWDRGGLVYIYKSYGINYMLGFSVNKKDIPDAILIRSLIPEEGIEIMKKNFGKVVRNIKDLTKSPGNLTKSFGITLEHYGLNLTKDILFIEDRGVKVKPEQIKISKRVGISPKIKGAGLKLRYLLTF